jgi:hypothetical protein
MSDYEFDNVRAMLMDVINEIRLSRNILFFLNLCSNIVQFITALSINFDVSHGFFTWCAVTGAGNASVVR